MHHRRTPTKLAALATLIGTAAALQAPAAQAAQPIEGLWNLDAKVSTRFNVTESTRELLEERGQIDVTVTVAVDGVATPFKTSMTMLPAQQQRKTCPRYTGTCAGPKKKSG